jgi:hypothetical protein
MYVCHARGGLLLYYLILVGDICYENSCVISSPYTFRNAMLWLKTCCDIFHLPIDIQKRVLIPIDNDAIASTATQSANRISNSRC